METIKGIIIGYFTSLKLLVGTASLSALVFTPTHVDLIINVVETPEIAFTLFTSAIIGLMALFAVSGYKEGNKTSLITLNVFTILSIISMSAYVLIAIKAIGDNVKTSFASNGMSVITMSISIVIYIVVIVQSILGYIKYTKEIAGQTTNIKEV